MNKIISRFRHQNSVLAKQSTALMDVLLTPVLPRFDRQEAYICKKLSKLVTT
jgi:hypothetical protein